MAAAENGKPVVRRGPFGTNTFPLNKNFKSSVVHLVHVYSSCHLLARRRQSAVVGYLKSYTWCCDMAKGVKDSFAHPVDLISGFLTDILQHCLIFIRR